MAEKVIPVRLAWSPELRKRFEEAGFTPSILDELTLLGEVWKFDELFVVLRSEGRELVWMASLGKGVKKWASLVLDIAKSAGATSMRFHIADDELAILRFWRGHQPTPILGEGLEGAYRIRLGGGNESV